MTDETKELIKISVAYLRHVLTENGASMAVDKSNGDLIFFDVAHYQETGRMNGFGVHFEELPQKSEADQ